MLIISLPEEEREARYLRIVHRDAQGGFEVCAVSTRFADLVSRGEVGASDRAVLELKATAGPSPLADGAVQGMTPVGAPQTRPA